MTPAIVEHLQLTLQLAASDEVAAAIRTQTRCARGVRGVSQGAIARAVDAAWRAEPVVLPADGPTLDRLFAAGWEDGLAAVSLLAAAVPDHPAEAIALADRWLADADDLATADAIGWGVLGPARIVQGSGPEALLVPGEILARRAAVMAGLAWLPMPLEGPCAAALRARVDRPAAAWVGVADDRAVGAVASHFARDREPLVQKAVRRLFRSWGTWSRPAALAWGRTFAGGLPRLLGDELAALAKRAQREQREQRS